MKLSNFFIVVLIFVAFQANSQSETFNLTVKVTNIEDVKGEILIALYNKEEGYLDEKSSVGKAVVSVKKSVAVYTFKNLKKGKYSVALMQDLDGDRKMDKNFMGIPQEPYGFSKNPKITFSAPSFEDCAVKLDENKSIEIKL